MAHYSGARNELNLIATRRLGEISAALEKAKGGEWTHKQHLSEVRTNGSKTAALSSVGVSRQRANEAEKLAKIDDGVFNLKPARAYGPAMRRNAIEAHRATQTAPDMKNYRQALLCLSMTRYEAMAGVFPCHCLFPMCPII
jgi:hypothetical protein